MSMKSKIISFFSSSRQYAVAGASNNPSKFGYKILNWYILHDLPVIPINPKEQEILGKEVVPMLPKSLMQLKIIKIFCLIKLHKLMG